MTAAAILPAARTYEELVARFRWSVPSMFNIAVACCDRWADGSGRIALVHESAGGDVERITFDALRVASARLGNVLRARGIGVGDRVAVLLPQGPEAATAHLAIYRIGAIAVPLFQLFGPDALEYRLRDSGAAAILTDDTGLTALAHLRESLPDLRTLLNADGARPGALSLWQEAERASDTCEPHNTSADDPAMIIYTSGTTGSPKGALLPHRTLIGHLPGVEMPQEMFPHPGDLFWTPADWAWIGGLLDVLLPSLFHGVPVLAHRMAKFDPERAFDLMARHQVRNAFMPPTALRMMRQVPDPRRFGHRLRSIGSGGETLGAETLDWGRHAFGLTINEFYGQTECNLVVANCAGLMPVKPGFMGRPVPGHDVAVIDAAGVACAPGEEGRIAVRRPDPAMFLGYWNNPEATAAKFEGDWLVTGDTGVTDDEGYIRFVARADDVITSAGYRIGPGEVEDCLLRHPAVSLAAVVGVPDALRTEHVTAAIVLRDGMVADDVLATEIQGFVRTRLAAHLYPRRVVFLESLPLTATGKVMRGALRRELAEKATSLADTPT
ncbi:AMP-dependent synthetase [Roseomonas fluvialis]|uniref:AMP-dependent synthetase n=2 Tax=Roseomonas fluvialis TaxID=1750527 RepID=A0ABN6NXR4_9PROT|nr:AMP-dependent synthetase [Roseomonas fluvialis]